MSPENDAVLGDPSAGRTGPAPSDTQNSLPSSILGPRVTKLTGTDRRDAVLAVGRGVDKAAQAHDAEVSFDAFECAGLPHIMINEDGLTIDALCAAAAEPANIVLTPSVERRCAAAQSRLQALIARGAVLYGVTTGFGPLAGRPVSSDETPTLQRGLIYHLATGVGTPLTWRAARALCLARLACLTQGCSGAGHAAMQALRSVIASDLAPLVPSQGTVGASGDLTPMAHVTLALMGNGDFVTEAGERVAGPLALKRLGIHPLDLDARDGLALVNGTAAMTGISALNHQRAARLIGWAEVLGVALGEVLGARAEAWDPSFGRVRPHRGQQATHRVLAALSQDGDRLTRGRLAALDTTTPGFAHDQRLAPQDAYTLRCLPQILGAARDVLGFHAEIVTRELNATTDNPILPLPDEGGVPLALHGGNFMGQHVAFAADALSTAVMSVAGLAERQVARVTDERLNGDLPPFLTRGRVGLQSGLMGAQVTASALLAEMRSRAVPASVLSISTNGANQDVVSMGTIAARSTARHLDDAMSILAILALAVAQGVDIRRASSGRDGFCSSTDLTVRAIRALSPPLTEDRPLSEDIARLAAWLDDTDRDVVIPSLRGVHVA
ncbi:MAG: aromatic amino acid ammonia-lyase [Pseudomonadota bacterium]